MKEVPEGVVGEPIEKGRPLDEAEGVGAPRRLKPPTEAWVVADPPRKLAVFVLTGGVVVAGPKENPPRRSNPPAETAGCGGGATGCVATGAIGTPIPNPPPPRNPVFCAVTPVGPPSKFNPPNPVLTGATAGAPIRFSPPNPGCTGAGAPNPNPRIFPAAGTG